MASLRERGRRVGGAGNELLHAVETDRCGGGGAGRRRRGRAWELVLRPLCVPVLSLDRSAAAVAAVTGGGQPLPSRRLSRAGARTAEAGCGGLVGGALRAAGTTVSPRSFVPLTNEMSDDEQDTVLVAKKCGDDPIASDAQAPDASAHGVAAESVAPVMGLHELPPESAERQPVDAVTKDTAARHRRSSPWTRTRQENPTNNARARRV